MPRMSALEIQQIEMPSFGHRRRLVVELIQLKQSLPMTTLSLFSHPSIFISLALVLKVYTTVDQRDCNSVF